MGVWTKVQNNVTKTVKLEAYWMSKIRVKQCHINH